MRISAKYMAFPMTFDFEVHTITFFLMASFSNFSFNQISIKFDCIFYSTPKIWWICFTHKTNHLSISNWNEYGICRRIMILVFFVHILHTEYPNQKFLKMDRILLTFWFQISKIYWTFFFFWKSNSKIWCNK